MFVDASALVAMVAGEPDASTLADKLEGAQVKLTSALALYEAAVAIARIRQASIEAAKVVLQEFVAEAELHIVAIGEPEFDLALQAFSRFGKGRHPARLNMGDCFAYACAKANGVPLLFKGEDFGLTDIDDA
jgi:ribonuclease VapC